MERQHKPAIVGNRPRYEAPPTTRQQNLEALRRVEAVVAESKRRAASVGQEVIKAALQPETEPSTVKYSQDADISII